MGERFERLGLAAQAAHHARVVRQTRPQHLGDHDREQVVVPDQVDLVAMPSAKQLEHRAAGSQLVAFLELPGLLVGYRGWHPCKDQNT
jgi:hypothetical protein